MLFCVEKKEEVTERQKQNKRGKMDVRDGIEKHLRIEGYPVGLRDVVSRG